MIDAAKLLEIIRLTGTKAAALALACGVFLYFATNEWLGKLEPLTLQLVVFVFLLSGFLALANLATASLQFFAIKQRFAGWMLRRGERRDFTNYLPHVTEDERKIFSYLLAKNQKMFTAANDGGHAATLLARNYVQIAIRGRQVVSPEDMPMEIPDHIWAVLVKNKNLFPYAPPKPGETETHPWRVNWMAR